MPLKRFLNIEMIDLFEGIATNWAACITAPKKLIEMIDLFEGIATQNPPYIRFLRLYWNDWPVWRDCDIALNFKYI